MANERTVGKIEQVFVGTSTTLLVPEVLSRFSLVIVNPTTDTCYVSLGDSVVTPSHYTYKMTRGSTVECPSWRGSAYAMMANIPNNILVTEEI